MSDATESVNSSCDGLNILESARKELFDQSSYNDGPKEHKSAQESCRQTGLEVQTGSRRSTFANYNDVDEGDDEQASEGLHARPKKQPGIQVEWSTDRSSSDDLTTSRGITRKRKRGLGVKGKHSQDSLQGNVVAKSRRNAKDAHLSASKNDSRTDNVEGLPEYLAQRRKQFEKRKATLKAAGLKLPPSYEEVSFSDDDQLETLDERPHFPKAKPIASYDDKQLPQSLGLIPAPVAQWLRDYQVQGVKFLHKLFVYQTGGILGDDMGLGKTIQVIAFLTAAFGKTGDERDHKRMRKMRRAGAKWYPRILIVCPGSLMSNWRSEFERWGWWHVDVFHGASKESTLQAAGTGRLEILITTYTTYRTNKDTLNRVSWDCVVADECHNIKGQGSETTQAMNEVNALCRIGLTGTAIQNNYEELWTLLNWANPGKFGPLSAWKTGISEPLKMGQSHEATLHQLGKARKVAKALVNHLLPQFFLRRMKTLISDQLPKKSDRVVFCPLTDTQADAYATFLDSEVVQTIKTSSDPCPCGSNKKSGWCCNEFLPDGQRWQAQVFPTIHYLQKMANHLAILIPDGNDTSSKQAKDLAALRAALPNQWRDIYRKRGSILNYSNSEFCGKWKVLKKLLAYWYTNGDKVLVFSHSKKLLGMFRLLFQSTAYSISYLDGAMSYDERAKEVDDFNADSNQFVFLISTKAGGVGLNITSANKVVILDPNWNPSWDLQAQDRAYRIGQSRDVEVFRLISAGTIEEIVYARQIYKQQQANIGYTASNERRYFTGIQNNVSQKGEIFGLQNLFAYAGGNIVLRDIVHKTNVAEARVGVTVTEVDLSTSSSSFDLGRPAGNSSGGGGGGDDGDDDDPLLSGETEDAAMSQLANIIAAEDPSAATAKDRSKRRATTKRADPIQAILAGAGVVYTHENSEVIGPSRVEAHLSRRAVEGGHDIEDGETRLFLAEHERSVQKPGASRSYSEPQWKYKPPIDVIRRQFCSMAKEFGFEDATEFALVVEGWKTSQRRACLDRFHRIRRNALGLDKKDQESV